MISQRQLEKENNDFYDHHLQVVKVYQTALLYCILLQWLSLFLVIRLFMT